MTVPWHDVAVTTHYELYTDHMSSSWHNPHYSGGSLHIPYMHAVSLKSIEEIKTQCGSDISCN